MNSLWLESKHFLKIPTFELQEGRAGPVKEAAGACSARLRFSGGPPRSLGNGGRFQLVISFCRRSMRFADSERSMARGMARDKSEDPEAAGRGPGQKQLKACVMWSR